VAQVVEEYDWDQKVIRDGKYPWSQWFNGAVWELTKGEDFDVDVAAFRRAVHSRAHWLGFKARTRTIKNDQAIVIQRIESTDE